MSIARDTTYRDNLDFTPACIVVSYLEGETTPYHVSIDRTPEDAARSLAIFAAEAEAEKIDATETWLIDEDGTGEKVVEAVAADFARVAAVQEGKAEAPIDESEKP